MVEFVRLLTTNPLQINQRISATSLSLVESHNYPPQGLRLKGYIIEISKKFSEHSREFIDAKKKACMLAPHR